MCSQWRRKRQNFNMPIHITVVRQSYYIYVKLSTCVSLSSICLTPIKYTVAKFITQTLTWIYLRMSLLLCMQFKPSTAFSYDLDQPAIIWLYRTLNCLTCQTQQSGRHLWESHVVSKTMQVKIASSSFCWQCPHCATVFECISKGSKVPGDRRSLQCHRNLGYSKS